MPEDQRLLHRRVADAGVEVGMEVAAADAGAKDAEQRLSAGRLAEVERRNRRLPDARPVPAWETAPPLE